MSTQPVAVTEQATASDPRKFSRKIDVPGGNPQIYYGATEQEVMDKMAEAIANGTLKIRELSRKTTLEQPKFETPEGADPYQDIPTPTVRELSNAEKLELSRKFADPEKVQEAFDQLYEARTGLKPEAVAKIQVQTARDSKKLTAHAEANAFAEAHPEFVQCSQNADAMMQYVQAHRMDLTKRNFEIAFRELKDSGLLILKQTEQPSLEPEVRTDPPKPEATQTAIPSALTRRNASGSDATPRKKGPTARELAMMSPSDLKKYYEETGQWPKK